MSGSVRPSTAFHGQLAGRTIMPAVCVCAVRRALLALVQSARPVDHLAYWRPRVERPWVVVRPDRGIAIAPGGFRARGPEGAVTAGCRCRRGDRERYERLWEVAR